MSRYIEINRFRELLGDIKAEYNFFDDEERPRYEAYSKALLILNDYIENEPSIDIVRCKECRHREEYPCKVYHDDDWYCADGEREGE